MTYFGSKYLGLITTWGSVNGLGVIKVGPGGGSNETSSQYTANNNSYTATIATGQIIVNGKYIDNTTEQYPLLQFRDVTYFPLTWRFAVDEFGWDYKFDMTNGLVINSK